MRMNLKSQNTVSRDYKIHSLKRRRNPRNYYGTGTTSHVIGDVLPSVMYAISRTVTDNPQVILEAWKMVIGPRIAPMTHAESFREGILYVKVNNSTLLSLLKQHEKRNILQKLRKKFPNTEIKTVVFWLG